MSKKQAFADKMLNWYDVSKRDFPFRQTRDPYKIWLSEIMAQQTQISTVIPYYERFIQAYPDFESLAQAKEDDVFKLWEGLGYYSRARRLIPCAKYIIDTYDGVFPCEYKDALALPGVGAYTAGAILSICYNRKVPAVDGNVLRVLTRYWADDGDIAKEKIKKNISEQIAPYMPTRAGDFNQSLIELGAVICSKASPKCHKCPISDNCKAFIADRVQEFPYKSKKKKSPVYKVAVSVVMHEDRFLVYKKDDDGLLGGFWAFPYDVIGNAAENYFVNESNCILDDLSGQPIGHVKHIFSHQVWAMDVTIYVTDSLYVTSEKTHRWVTLEEMNALAFTTAMKKVIKVIFNWQRDNGLIGSLTGNK